MRSPSSAATPRAYGSSASRWVSAWSASSASRAWKARPPKRAAPARAINPPQASWAGHSGPGPLPGPRYEKCVRPASRKANDSRGYGAVGRSRQGEASESAEGQGRLDSAARRPANGSRSPLMLPEQDAASDWCLQQGGEMGARMRAFDWSRTPLGPLAHWPQPLKVAVALCLLSRFPIVIFWGPEYAMLYNDAYIPLLGTAKHPGWLGMSGRDCWREVWPTVGPMMERVLATGEPVWFEDLMLIIQRRLPREECYFTFSYSAIPAGGNAAGGIVCIGTETT